MLIFSVFFLPFPKVKKEHTMVINTTIHRDKGQIRGSQRVYEPGTTYNHLKNALGSSGGDTLCCGYEVSTIHSQISR